MKLTYRDTFAGNKFENRFAKRAVAGFATAAVLISTMPVMAQQRPIATTPSTGNMDTVRTTGIVTQHTKPTLMKAGDVVATVQTLHGIPSHAEWRVSKVDTTGIEIYPLLAEQGAMTDDRCPLQVYRIPYGEAKYVGSSLSSLLHITAEKGSDNSAMVTAVFMPPYVTKTQVVTAGELVAGTYISVAKVDSTGVMLDDNTTLQFGQTRRIGEYTVSMTITAGRIPGTTKAATLRVTGPVTDWLVQTKK